MTKQVINIGSVANDGTGTNLRDGGDMINDNFTELYNDVAALQAITATPVSGSSDQLRAGVKYFITKEVYITDLFYVSKVENGVSGHVIIQVSKTNSLSAAGTIIMESDRTTTAKTGWEIVALSPKNSSGLYGIIVIDWDQFTSGVSNTYADWTVGGLYAINTYKQSSGTGTNTENIAMITGDTVDVDGSYDQYAVNGDGADVSLTMVLTTDLKGTVKVNNYSPTYNVKVYRNVSNSNASFNGAEQEYIIVAPNTYVEIALASALEFIVKGTYSNPV